MKHLDFQHASGHYQMTPAQLRSIRMDMGINMTAMSNVLARELSRKISRNVYRAWERPRGRNAFPYIPSDVAAVAQNVYLAFHDFVDTLVAMWDGEDPLVLIHRNDMFEEADLPLPPYISVHNYNQAVGKAWGIIIRQGYMPETVYFSTPAQPKSPTQAQNRPPEVA